MTKEQRSRLAISDYTKRQNDILADRIELTITVERLATSGEYCCWTVDTPDDEDSCFPTVGEAMEVQLWKKVDQIMISDDQEVSDA